MPRFINPVPQYLNSAGDPIVSGEMYFYEIGSTTPKDTYLDAELTIPATNPVLLNADGRLPDTYLLGSYRTVLREPSTGDIWERDNVGSEFSEGYGSEWNSTVTYNIPDVVLFNGVYYVCQTNNNLNNSPSSTSSFWSVQNLGSYESYSSAGVFTFVAPSVLSSGNKKAKITVIGAGGGGARGQNAQGGGGASGPTVSAYIDLTGVTSVPVTVGAGGLGASTNGTEGGDGGTTSFGSFLSLTGGNGGTLTGRAGRGVITASVPLLLEVSGSNGNGVTSSRGGDGGAGPYGGPGLSGGAVVDSSDATACGSGGAGGGGSGKSGSNGFNGLVLIEW